MSADASASSYVPAQAPAREPTVAPEPAVEAPAAVYWHGNPAALGLPCFIAGSVALGLAFVGVVPLTALGAAVPIVLTATSIGLFLATIWAAAVGQTAVASVFGIFGGFWLSYAVLSLGLNHNWFAIPLTSTRVTLELFLVSWLVVILMLTLATLRLPMAFTAVFFLVDVALLLVFLGVNEGSTGLLKAAGYVAFAFAAIGVYLFFSSASVATGGRPLPLGRPALHG
jgi:succinate-acetate transporter protein